MNPIYRRDHTDIDYEAIRRRQALTSGIDQLSRAASALHAARSGDEKSMRDAVLSDAQRRLCSMQAELRALE
jgi:hypothetical protein